MREYACETCLACRHTTNQDGRYKRCRNLQTVRCRSYNCSGKQAKFNTKRYLTTGWLEHRIEPYSLSPTATTRSVTSGLIQFGRSCRMKYISSLRIGDCVMMANLTECRNRQELIYKDFWLALLLPRNNQAK